MESASPHVELDASTPPTSMSLEKPACREDDYTTSISNVAGLFRTLMSQDGDFVIFQDVEQDIFQKAKAARKHRGSKIRLHYYPAQRRLLVTIPTFPHEMANGGVSAGVYRDLNNMGLSEDDLWPTNSTEFVGGDGSSGEPDACFMPPVRGNDPGGWPTMVIETGVSQSLASLRSKMRWWFAASSHAVKVCLLIKASRASQTLLLEKYIMDAPQTRHGVTSTRNKLGLAPQLRQSITIIPQPGSNPAVYDVLGGPLVMDFSLLFLRPADAARGERDILVDISRLAKLAERVWARVWAKDEERSIIYDIPITSLHTLWHRIRYCITIQYHYGPHHEVRLEQTEHCTLLHLKILGEISWVLFLARSADSAHCEV